MFSSISGRSHLFRQQGSEAGTILLVDSDIGTPVGHVVGVVARHASRHSGHQPRIAVVRVIAANALTLIGRNEVVVTLGHGVFDIVTSAQRLDTKNVVEVEAFITRNGGSWEMVLVAENRSQ